MVEKLATWLTFTIQVISLVASESLAKVDLHEFIRIPENAVSVEHREEISAKDAEEWLVANSRGEPWLQVLSDNYLRENAEYAVRAREEVSPASSVPRGLFLREVLPPVNLDEPVDHWRPLFYEKLAPEVRHMRTLREVADRVVPLVFQGRLGGKVKFQANNTPEIMAPVSETLSRGYASCTGLSILLVDALRSVGVPARLVGTANWNTDTAGNHNWIEAWFDGAWHFLDAVPTQAPAWDSAWFVPGAVLKAEAGGEHGIYSPVWNAADADARYALGWRDPAKLVPARDRTSDYHVIARRVNVL